MPGNPYDGRTLVAEAFVVLNPYHPDDTASVQSDPKTTFFTDDELCR